MTEKDIHAEAIEHSSTAQHDAALAHIKSLETGPVMDHVQDYQAAEHINLSWRSWMVVFVTCWAIMAQVFVVVAAGSVIAFIIRDLGDASLAGWIIQGPLLMQSVLSPIVGRLSDVLDRKWLCVIPPLIAFVGAVVSARANSMSEFISSIHIALHHQFCEPQYLCRHKCKLSNSSIRLSEAPPSD